MEYEVITKYIRPELLVLVVVLYLIGVAIKKSQYLKDWMIPFVLGFIGLSLAAIYVLSVSPAPKTYQEGLGLIFDIIIQGICCASAATYTNQITKQYGKMKAGE